MEIFYGIKPHIRPPHHPHLQCCGRLYYEYTYYSPYPIHLPAFLSEEGCEGMMAGIGTTVPLPVINIRGKSGRFTLLGKQASRQGLC